MKIYFSCSITGGREDQDIYAEIVNHLLEHKYEVLTAHLADDDVVKEESIIDPVDVFKRDIDWVRTCDVLIAEISTPSHGVGYEIAEAINNNKPVLCCHNKDRKVSKILSGNTSDNYKVIAYSGTEELLEEIDTFLIPLFQSE